MPMDSTLQAHMDSQTNASVEELDETEIACRLSAGEADIQAGRVCSQAGVDTRMNERFRHE